MVKKISKIYNGHPHTRQLLNGLAVILFGDNSFGFGIMVLILTAKTIEPTKKLIWLFGTLFLPVIGPVLLFFSLSTLKRAE